MSKRIHSLRGMHDALPADTPLLRHIETTLQNALMRYGYQEIRMPHIEHTELFARSIGEQTDIVEKEMYCFADRNGDSLTLRPEGTASCVRAGLEHGLLHNQQQRLWYCGPFFRHERPQKGRYRQFHQIGAETFGIPGPDIDAELILMTADMWRGLGIDRVRLEINSLGSVEARAAYRDSLIEYFQHHQARLDEDSSRRLHGNPLRILDSKNPAMQGLIAGAPSLLDALDTESAAHFDGLKRLLDNAGLAYRVNPRLVRGLDYYTRTVFEWISEDLGAQGTICAGGRYDGLVEQLDGRATPAAGFAIGLERLRSLLATRAGDAPAAQADVYMAAVGEAAVTNAFRLAAELRDAIPGLVLLLNCGGGSMKTQLKRADRSGARLALVLGADEVERGMVAIKYLRAAEAQAEMAQADLVPYLQALLAGG